MLGIEWKKVFSHNHPVDLGEAGFFIDHADAMNKNSNDEDADMFSILDKLEEYRTCNGTFHLKLCYPELFTNFSFPCNEWIQFNNPALDSLSMGFVPINITFESAVKTFSGLSLSDRGKDESLMQDFPYIYKTERSFHIGSLIGKEGKIVGPPAHLVEKVELFLNPGKSQECKKTLKF